MNRISSYFFAQLKRVFKILPIQLLINLVVGVCVGSLAVLFVREGVLAPGRMKYRIGVVGDMTDSYLGFGLGTLQAVDDSRFIIELVGMEEAEAKEAFHRGDLYAYVRIPDGLIESIENGANDRPVTYIVEEGQRGLGSIVMTEIVDVVSGLITSTQSGIYGMQEILMDYGKTEGFWEATDELNFRYFDIVLGRKNLYDMEILGIANGLSTGGYYFCGILIFTLLLSGISNSLLFSKRSRGLPRFLAAKGVGAAGQVAGEYLAYTGMEVVCILEMFLMLAAVFGSGIISIAEWKGMGARPLPVFLMSFFPVILMVSAMQFLIYETVENVVSSVLLQFLCAVSMGYLSGFFYPAGFFPEILRKAGEILPTGAAMRWTGGCMTGTFSWTAFTGIITYLLCFLAMSVLVRKSKILWSVL